MRGSRFAAVYLLVQAAAFACWWGVLLLWPRTRQPFVVPGSSDSALLAFSLADAAVVVASTVAAVGLWRGRAWARPVLWAVVGAVVYAALYCVAAWLDTGGAGWAAAAMVPAAVASVVVGLRA